MTVKNNLQLQKNIGLTILPQQQKWRSYSTFEKLNLYKMSTPYFHDVLKNV